MLGKGKKSLISATHAHPQQPLDGSKTERERDREEEEQEEAISWQSKSGRVFCIGEWGKTAAQL